MVGYLYDDLCIWWTIYWCILTVTWIIINHHNHCSHECISKQYCEISYTMTQDYHWAVCDGGSQLWLLEGPFWKPRTWKSTAPKMLQMSYGEYANHRGISNDIQVLGASHFLGHSLSFQRNPTVVSKAPSPILHVRKNITAKQAKWSAMGSEAKTLRSVVDRDPGPPAHNTTVSWSILWFTIKIIADSLRAASLLDLLIRIYHSDHYHRQPLMLISINQRLVVS